MASEGIQRRIDSLLDEADAAVSKYEWEAVREAAQAVLALDPDNADATTYIAAAERAQGATTDSAASATPPETTPARPTITAASTPEAERRQLAVMFCDLQGSTALS
jgi:hypothetical protein